jgi:hypothetical protein
VLVFSLSGIFFCQPLMGQGEGCEETVVAKLSMDKGHPWRPPFGLDKVGQPATAMVEISSDKPFTYAESLKIGPQREYTLVSYLNGKEVGRHVLFHASEKTTNKFAFPVRFEIYPDELVLFAKCGFKGETVEVAREKVQPPAFEAGAVARPSEVINPVDLGAILVPHDWLLLGPGQRGEVEVAALTRTADIPGARVAAWFESAEKQKVGAEIKLNQNVRADVRVPLPAITPTVDHDRLLITITEPGGKEIWRKQIETMFVRKAPQWPEFGAVETKLRYDMPISVRDAETGELSTLPYAEGWKPDLQDVVVTFPNGARFVMWRGNGYVPFWAGRDNTAMCHLWAIAMGPSEAAGDGGLEGYSDKDLRYNRARIMESTASRVHVRWSYQSCDAQCKAFGHSAEENFYFYPDGFGSRVVTTIRDPAPELNLNGLSEMIILTPAQAYPLEVIPTKTADMLFMDGKKFEVDFPTLALHLLDQGVKYDLVLNFPDDIAKKTKSTPAVYRIYFNKSDKFSAVYFTPYVTRDAPRFFAPLFDHGVPVTPAYWGAHWPVARGKSITTTLDDRIYDSVAHNSTITWPGGARPQPLFMGNFETLDGLGRAKTMTVGEWEFWIGLTDASDSRVLECMRSFSHPPSLEISGARYDTIGYAPERRALRLVVEGRTVTIKIKPTVRCVNPVFELLEAPKELQSVTLGGQRLSPKEYAWDGTVLWLKTDVDQPEELRLQFGEGSR